METEFRRDEFFKKLTFKNRGLHRHAEPTPSTLRMNVTRPQNGRAEALSFYGL